MANLGKLDPSSTHINLRASSKIFNYPRKS
jgi:hypothetical protein